MRQSFPCCSQLCQLGRHRNNNKPAPCSPPGPSCAPAVVPPVCSFFFLVTQNNKLERTSSFYSKSLFSSFLLGCVPPWNILFCLSFPFLFLYSLFSLFFFFLFFFNLFFESETRRSGEGTLALLSAIRKAKGRKRCFNKVISPVELPSLLFQSCSSFMLYSQVNRQISLQVLSCPEEKKVQRSFKVLFICISFLFGFGVISFVCRYAFFFV